MYIICYGHKLWSFHVTPSFKSLCLCFIFLPFRLFYYTQHQPCPFSEIQKSHACFMKLRLYIRIPECILTYMSTYVRITDILEWNMRICDLQEEVDNERWNLCRTGTWQLCKKVKGNCSPASCVWSICCIVQLWWMSSCLTLIKIYKFSFIGRQVISLSPNQLYLLRLMQVSMSHLQQDKLLSSIIHNM